MHAIAKAPVQPAPVVEDEDDPSVSVTAGTICRRKGCGLEFESDEANRIGDGEGTVCTYHPAPVSRRGYLKVKPFFNNLRSPFSGKAVK
jgi:hypothetical protein